MRVPWTASRANQSNLKEINPDYSLEGMMLKLMLEKIEGRSRRQRQKIRWLDGLPDSMDLSLSKTPGDSGGQGNVMQSMGSQRIGHDLVTEQQPSY